MIKCRRKQSTDPQRLKKIVNSHFLLVEAEAIALETEAVGEIAASTSLVAKSNKVIFYEKSGKN